MFFLQRLSTKFSPDTFKLFFIGVKVLYLVKMLQLFVLLSGNSEKIFFVMATGN